MQQSREFLIHHEVDERLEAEWDDLARRHGTRFASRPAYALSWFRAVGKGRLAVATVRRGGELAAVLPLHVRRRAGVEVARLLGHGLGTVGEAPATDRAALEYLVDGLRREQLPLELTHLPAGSPFLEVLLAADGLHVDLHRDDHCPVIDVPEGTTVPDLRSSKTRSRLSRARRKWEAQHGVVDRILVQTPEELERHWSEIVTLTELADDAAGEGRLHLLSGEHGQFTHRFLREEAAAGHLVVIGLTVDGRWVGLQVLLTTGGRAEGWLNRFDPGCRPLIPGHQLVEKLIDVHDELGVTVIDMMIGRSPFKSDWETGEYHVFSVSAVAAENLRALRWARAVSRGGMLAAGAIRRVTSAARRGRSHASRAAAGPTWPWRRG